MTIRNQKDFWAGLMFIAFGAFFGGFGTQYTIGTAAKMGPGYFPISLGVLLMALGLLVSLKALSPKADAEEVGKFDWFVIGWILAGVVAFGILLSPAGLVISLVILVAVTSYASHEFHPVSTAINALVLTIGCYIIFVWGLKLQFQLWPAFLIK